MSNKTHLAVEANKKSIKYAMEGNKEAWLALYTEDAVVCDPVGISPMDPSGEGHHGKRWTSGEYCCCVAQVAKNAVGDGNFTECDMLATYHVNEEGLITSMKAHWSFDDMMDQLGKL